MRITLNRSAEVLPGTHWRPIEFAADQRRMVETVRRETPDGSPDKVVRRYETGPLDELDVLLAERYVETRVEDQYKRGKYREGYYYLRSMGVFAHESVVERVEELTGRIEPGAIIAKETRVHPDAYIESGVELEQGVRVKHGARIGRGSVVRKGSIIAEDAAVGALAYVGQFSRIGGRATVGAMSIVGREVAIADDALLGRQNVVGMQSYVMNGAWLDDSVTLGKNVHVSRNASIGEMTKIGANSHIGESSMVGAESQLGRFVRVGRGVFLASPAIASDGEAILTSSVFAPRFKE
ncbi:hypothetical protein E6P97_00150 [Patescibacteria group bacterium]|nr:MAG: hypothetical protein E6P97_00150 [Patescibacteria group bacterium]